MFGTAPLHTLTCVKARSAGREGPSRRARWAWPCDIRLPHQREQHQQKAAVAGKALLSSPTGLDA
jgi:hypothetical protein